MLTARRAIPTNFFRKNGAASAVPSISKSICCSVKRLTFEKLAMAADSFGKRVRKESVPHIHIFLKVWLFLIEKRKSELGILNLVQVKVGEQIPAALLQDTDGSARHPYQFFLKKR
jgi:hypothetical protein